MVCACVLDGEWGGGMVRQQGVGAGGLCVGPIVRQTIMRLRNKFYNSVRRAAGIRSAKRRIGAISNDRIGR